MAAAQAAAAEAVAAAPGEAVAKGAAVPIRASLRSSFDGFLGLRSVDRQQGFTERQARFLVLVMRHTGVCLMRQYSSFAGIVFGQKTRVFFAKLVERNYASTYDCAHNRARIYHVRHRELYEAIGEPDSRLRRPPAIATALERVMLLDAMLASPDIVWLATPDEKVAPLSTLTRIPLDDLPHVTIATVMRGKFSTSLIVSRSVFIPKAASSSSTCPLILFATTLGHSFNVTLRWLPASVHGRFGSSFQCIERRPRRTSSRLRAISSPGRSALVFGTSSACISRAFARLVRVQQKEPTKSGSGATNGHFRRPGIQCCIGPGSRMASAS